MTDPCNACNAHTHTTDPPSAYQPHCFTRPLLPFRTPWQRLPMPFELLPVLSLASCPRRLPSAHLQHGRIVAHQYAAANTQSGVLAGARDVTADDASIARTAAEVSKTDLSLQGARQSKRRTAVLRRTTSRRSAHCTRLTGAHWQAVQRGGPCQPTALSTLHAPLAQHKNVHTTFILVSC